MDWIQSTKLYKGIFVHFTGKPFPQDPFEQLKISILSCFNSNSSIPGQKFSQLSLFQPASSVILQRTFFGGRKGKSASCIFNTHDMATGELRINGMFAENADLPDIKLGYVPVVEAEQMKTKFQQEHSKIIQCMEKLPKLFYHPMTCFFVINERNVYLLEAQKTLFPGTVGLIAASELIKDEFNEQKVINEIMPCEMLSVCKRHLISPPKSILCRGISGSNGAATGVVSVSNEDCIQRSQRGEKVILFKHSLSFADIEAALSAVAIVTESGSDYSFSAQFARSIGMPAAVACDRLSVDATKGIVEVNNMSLNVGEEVSVENGCVYVSAIPLSEPSVEQDSSEILETIKKLKDQNPEKIDILAKVSKSVEVKAALLSGADGIGSYEAEEIFSENLDTLMNIFSEPENKDYQAQFESLLADSLTQALNECSNNLFTFSLLSKPITDFLPSQVELTKKIAELRTRKELQDDFSDGEELSKLEKQLDLVKRHSESNPLMGLRGTRLAIRYPEIFNCQVNALIKAISNSRRSNEAPPVRLVLPVTTLAQEVKYLKEKLISLIQDKNIKIGPSFSSTRACLTAEKCKEYSDFFVINTQELQETLFGMNENDVRRSFLPEYVATQIFDFSPFDSLDDIAAGELIAQTSAHGTTECPVGVYGNICAEKHAFKEIRSCGAGFLVCTPETVAAACLCAAQTQ